MNDEESVGSSDNDNDLPLLSNAVPGGALWVPTDDLADVDINQFLSDIVELREAHGQSFSDRFSKTRDDEDALCALYRHRFDRDKAKAAFPFPRVNQPFRTVRQGALEWDLGERDLFERGIAMYGKNFSVIQKRLLPYRRVGELVEYYYFWKKTDRSDNDGVLPDMAGGGLQTSVEADVTNLTTTAASSQLSNEPPAPLSASGDGDDEPKAERGDIWWNDDVPVAQV
ncbi:hypothetical protein GCK32_016607 [Trichostrongylus colubriformis]|uniref:Uncharacterized protein n=1 Tax=Trichostrongylus colubriformis TaxID=6319 RepID=A0AAN8FVB8_TRICO